MSAYHMMTTAMFTQVMLARNCGLKLGITFIRLCELVFDFYTRPLLLFEIWDRMFIFHRHIHTRARTSCEVDMPALRFHTHISNITFSTVPKYSASRLPGYKNIPIALFSRSYAVMYVKGYTECMLLGIYMKRKIK